MLAGESGEEAGGDGSGDEGGNGDGGGGGLRRRRWAGGCGDGVCWWWRRRWRLRSLSRTGAPLEVMFIDSKALLIAKGGKGTLDPHACNPRAAAHHCSARDTVAGPTPIAIHRRT